MRKHLLAAAAAAALAVSACQSGTSSPSPTTASGSLALSSDDALLYAADTDTGTVSVVDTRTRQKIAEVKVGLLPERLVVGPDDTLYVANGGERSVSVIRRNQWTEAARIAVGVEPSGLSVSPDGRTLYVVNATSLSDAHTGSLQAIDTATLQTKWELPVGEEPRGLALLADDKAAVALFKQGELVVVDLAKGEVVSRSGESLYQQANRAALSGAVQQDAFGTASTFRPRSFADVVASPDGRRLYVPSTWSSEGVLGGDSMGGGGGAAYGGGPCMPGGVASPGIVTFEAEGARALVDDVSECRSGVQGEKDYPASLLTTSFDSQPVQGPTVAALDPTGNWLFVVNRETDNVAVVSTSRAPRSSGVDPMFGRSAGSVHTVVSVGSGPNGIALTRDGRTAYVYNQFDHSISTLVSEGGTIRQVGEPLQVAEDVLSPDAVAGRKLFHTAVDSRMSASTNMSCAGCHPAGREDGHVWLFPEGPRQTPSLAGRQVTQTAPFHWNGEFSTLDAFLNTTVGVRMGGSGVTPAMGAQLAAFIDSMPAPDSPFRVSEDQLSPTQLHGKQVFAAAGCDGCHAGAAFTNNTFADVGTLVQTGPAPDDVNVLREGLNTPSLLGLSRTAPYLHDGSAQSLKERLMMSKDTDLHGTTSQLTEQDVDALVEYLHTL